MLNFFVIQNVQLKINVISETEVLSLNANWSLKLAITYLVHFANLNFFINSAKPSTIKIVLKYFEITLYKNDEKVQTMLIIILKNFEISKLLNVKKCILFEIRIYFGHVKLKKSEFCEPTGRINLELSSLGSAYVMHGTQHTCEYFAIYKLACRLLSGSLYIFFFHFFIFFYFTVFHDCFFSSPPLSYNSCDLWRVALA